MSMFVDEELFDDELDEDIEEAETRPPPQPMVVEPVIEKQPEKPRPITGLYRGSPYRGRV